MPTATLRTYKNYREKIRTGDLILFESRDIVSKTIALFTKNTKTHAAMAKWIDVDSEPRLFILESVLPGVCLNYLSNRVAWWLPHGDMFWYKMRTDYELMGDKAADILMKKIGTFYDFKNLFWQAFKRVAFDPKNFFCSEAVGWPWHILIERGEEYIAPYPHELCSEEFGIYETEGAKIT
jgi:hypothetical protein